MARPSLFSRRLTASPPNLSSMAQGTALKESLALWRDELKAAPLI